jgi:hypothetical protein
MVKNMEFSNTSPSGGLVSPAHGADSIENATRFVIQLEEKISTLERMPNRCPFDARKGTFLPIGSFPNRG